MPKDEQYTLIKDEILQITRELKSHIYIGDFIDPDKNFTSLLEKIIGIFDKNDTILEIINNQEMHLRYKTKYEEAAEYIKLIESGNVNKEYKKEFNNSNDNSFKSRSLHNNKEEVFYFGECPKNQDRISVENDTNLKSRKSSSKVGKLIEEKKETNKNQSLIIFGIESDRIRDEYISIYEDKKNLEHQNLILNEKLVKLEDLDKNYQDLLFQMESINEKNKFLSEEIFNLRERVKKIGNENIELINLNNQYIEAIKLVHSENGITKNKISNENSKIKILKKELEKNKEKIISLEKEIDDMTEKFMKEQEERYYIETQYQDFIYERENEILSLREENQKILKDNFLEKFLEIKDTHHKLDFFYNDETNKIEIFVNEEKLIDFDNTKPKQDSQFINEESNQSRNQSEKNSSKIIENYLKESPIDYKRDILIKSKNESLSNPIEQFKDTNLHQRKYSSDIFLEKKKNKIATELSFNKIDSESDTKVVSFEKKPDKTDEINSNQENESENNSKINQNISVNLGNILNENDFFEKNSRKNKYINNSLDSNENKNKTASSKLSNIITNNYFNFNSINDNFSSKKSSTENLENINLKNNNPLDYSMNLNYLKGNKNENKFVKNKIKSKNTCKNLSNKKCFHLNKRDKHSKSISFGVIKTKDLNDILNAFTLNSTSDKNDAIKDKLSKNNTPLKWNKFNRFRSHHTRAFLSQIKPVNFLLNLKNKMKNESVNAFTLENLDNLEDDDDNKNFKKEQENIIIEANIENQLFKSGNSSFINDKEISPLKYERRRTLNNMNFFSNKFFNGNNDEDSYVENPIFNPISSEKTERNNHKSGLGFTNVKNILEENEIGEENDRKHIILEDLLQEDLLIDLEKYNVDNNQDIFSDDINMEKREVKRLVDLDVSPNNLKEIIHDPFYNKPNYINNEIFILNKNFSLSKNENTKYEECIDFTGFADLKENTKNNLVYLGGHNKPIEVIISQNYKSENNKRINNILDKDDIFSNCLIRSNINKEKREIIDEIYIKKDIDKKLLDEHNTNNKLSEKLICNDHTANDEILENRKYKENEKIGLKKNFHSSDEINLNTKIIFEKCENEKADSIKGKNNNNLEIETIKISELDIVMKKSQIKSQNIKLGGFNKNVSSTSIASNETDTIDKNRKRNSIKISNEKIQTFKIKNMNMEKKKKYKSFIESLEINLDVENEEPNWENSNKSKDNLNDENQNLGKKNDENHIDRKNSLDSNYNLKHKFNQTKIKNYEKSESKPKLQDNSKNRLEIKNKGINPLIRDNKPENRKILIDKEIDKRYQVSPNKRGEMAKNIIESEISLVKKKNENILEKIENDIFESERSNFLKNIKSNEKLDLFSSDINGEIKEIIEEKKDNNLKLFEKESLIENKMNTNNPKSEQRYEKLNEYEKCIKKIDLKIYENEESKYCSRKFFKKSFDYTDTSVKIKQEFNIHNIVPNENEKLLDSVYSNGSNSHKINNDDYRDLKDSINCNKKGKTKEKVDNSNLKRRPHAKSFLLNNTRNINRSDLFIGMNESKFLQYSPYKTTNLRHSSINIFPKNNDIESNNQPDKRNFHLNNNCSYMEKNKRDIGDTIKNVNSHNKLYFSPFESLRENKLSKFCKSQTNIKNMNHFNKILSEKKTEFNIDGEKINPLNEQQFHLTDTFIHEIPNTIQYSHIHNDCQNQKSFFLNKNKINSQIQSKIPFLEKDNSHLPEIFKQSTNNILFNLNSNIRRNYFFRNIEIDRDINNFSLLGRVEKPKPLKKRNLENIDRKEERDSKKNEDNFFDKNMYSFRIMENVENADNKIQTSLTTVKDVELHEDNQNENFCQKEERMSNYTNLSLVSKESSSKTSQTSESNKELYKKDHNNYNNKLIVDVYQKSFKDGEDKKYCYDLKQKKQIKSLIRKASNNFLKEKKEEIYGLDNVSEISMKNRRNILARFCKEKDLNLNISTQYDKEIETGLNEEKNFSYDRYEKNNEFSKISNPKNIGKFPMEKKKILYKSMQNEPRKMNREKERDTNYRFEGKSYEQDATILKEEKKNKCNRCIIF